MFNCGTDKYVSYKAICDMIHSALNSDKEKDVKYMYFDPTLVSIHTCIVLLFLNTFISTPIMYIISSYIARKKCAFHVFVHIFANYTNEIEVPIMFS